MLYKDIKIYLCFLSSLYIEIMQKDKIFLLFHEWCYTCWSSCDTRNHYLFHVIVFVPVKQPWKYGGKYHMNLLETSDLN